MHQAEPPPPPEKLNPKNKKYREICAFRTNELCRAAGVVLLVKPTGIHAHSAQGAARLRQHPGLLGLIARYAPELRALLDDMVE